MMTSLMSIFDPVSSLFLFPMGNWIIITFSFFLIKNKFWLSDSTLMLLMNNLVSSLLASFKASKVLSVSLFMFIMMMNFLGLLPLTFSPTSHLVFNMSISLTFWLGMFLWYLSNNLEKFFSHLTPMGCPVVLVPFMIIIEMISNLIRPITLGLRLMANVMAGHMILSLISGSIISTPLSGSVMMLILTLFSLFELGVAIIQAYVFSSLMDLYWEESSHI